MNVMQNEDELERKARPASPLNKAMDRLRGFSLRTYAIIGAVALAVIVGGSWLHHQFTHVYVNDARVAADMISVSSRVPGWVTTVNVITGDSANAGDLLIQIDDRDSTLTLQGLNAQLQGLTSRRAEIEARITLTDRQTASAIEAQQAAVSAAQATLASAETQRDLAQTENNRAERLAPDGAITQSRLDQTRAALETAEQQVNSARAQLDSARAALAQAQAAREELTVLHHQLDELGPQEDQLQARRDQAQLDLSDRTILMPFDGVVDDVFIHEGEYVSPGQRLVLVHDPSHVRVEANVKETDLRYFQPGRHVRVTVDALPGRHFRGTVERVGQAATSESALLPSPNPSGNFTKITQRFGIRVAVEQQEDMLRPGMMVEVEARARD